MEEIFKHKLRDSIGLFILFFFLMSNMSPFYKLEKFTQRLRNSFKLSGLLHGRSGGGGGGKFFKRLIYNFYYSINLL